MIVSLNNCGIMSVVTSPCRCTNIAIIALIKLTLTTKVSIASYINLGLAFSVGCIYIYIDLVYIF